MQTMEQVQVEEVSVDEATPPDIGAGVAIAGADSLHAALGERADDLDVNGFKCVKCGLVHQHDTTKHRLSDTFDVSDADAASIEYNSVCHCGVQEAGRHGSDLGIDESRAAGIAGNAPIPPEASREMNEAFGTL